MRGMPARVLLVDDDQALAALLADYLGAEGFAVSCAHDGDHGTALALAGGFDIVVLDVMMPGTDGITALRHIRTVSAVPVLMLTARGDDADRIVGLELGADDYVPKPCTPRELAARLRAILKRTQPAEPALGMLSAGDVTLWPARRIAEQGGQRLALTATEFNLLVVLARHAGRAVSKETLSQEALQRPLTRYDRSIDVHISSIRQKLAPCADGRSPIQTVIRQGYLLVA